MDEHTYIHEHSLSNTRYGGSMYTNCACGSENTCTCNNA